MKERIVIVFVAVALGLTVTTLGFFIYQSTKIVPKDSLKTLSKKNPFLKPTPDLNKIYITVDEPADESVTDKRTVVVKGKTRAENTIVISSNQEDTVVSPAADGRYSATITIDAGTNKLIVRALTPHGEENIQERIISFTTEDF